MAFKKKTETASTAASAKPTNVIQWANPGPDDIVYRYEADNIRTVSALIVREWEVAVFMRDGQLYDVMGPGKHTLSTGNIPLLTKAYSKLLGYGESPFKAEVIFVSTKIQNGKWGVRADVQVSDTNLLYVPMMANGDYQFRVNDATLFLTQVIGGQGNYNTAAVNSFMRGVVTEQIAQQISKQYFLEAQRNREKASTTTKALIDDYFTQRGMELLMFKIASIQTDAKHQEEINKLQRINSSGGLQDRQLEAMENVASGLGQGGGGAAIGAGMFMMPQMMQNMMPNQQGQQSPKAVCQSCGALNDYPYKFCKECGKPPVAQKEEKPEKTAGASEASGGNKGFSRCPYCGETLNLPKPPKYCPYCSEQLQ